MPITRANHEAVRCQRLFSGVTTSAEGIVGVYAAPDEAARKARSKGTTRSTITWDSGSGESIGRRVRLNGEQGSRLSLKGRSRVIGSACERSLNYSDDIGRL